MSAEVQKAAVNEALELSYLFRQNAALRNGLPDCKKNTIANLDEPQPAAPPVVNITNQIPAATHTTETLTPGDTGADAAAKSSLLRRAAPWLLSGATLAGGAAAGWLLAPDAKPQPAPVEQPNDGSLLQYLQDTGHHLRESESWQTK